MNIIRNVTVCIWKKKVKKNKKTTILSLSYLRFVYVLLAIERMTGFQTIYRVIYRGNKVSRAYNTLRADFYLPSDPRITGAVSSGRTCGILFIAGQW